MSRFPNNVVAIIGGVWLLAVSCTSTNDAELEFHAPTTATILGPATDAAISGGELVDPGSVVLSVSHGACDELEGWSSETDDEVTVGVRQRVIETVSDDDQVVFACGDIGLVDEVTIELEEPLGERNFVIAQSGAPWIESGGFCFVDELGCRPFDLLIGSERVAVAPLVEVNPIDVAMGSGRTSELTVGDVVLELTTAESFDHPHVTVHLRSWEPETGISRSVTIHNRNRPLDLAAPAEQTVDGHAAWLVSYADDDPVYPPVVVIEAGPWWIEVALLAPDLTDQPKLMRQFLEGLTIDEPVGDIPRVSDAEGRLLSNLFELTIVDRPHGFLLGVDPNCEPVTEPGCVVDVGYILPAYDPGYPLPGDLPGFGEYGTETIVPDDLVVRIADMGIRGELIACTGVPAFDAELLPDGLSLGEATSTVEIYTGLRDWSVRIQPGVETHFVGEADDPSTVATYLRNTDGSWRVESVLSCR